jgi:hypothetical protein
VAKTSGGSEGKSRPSPSVVKNTQPVRPEPEKETGSKPAATKTFLTVTSAPPFAEVIVDGRFMGNTPVKDKELPPGRHKLTVTHRSFPPVDTVVNLRPGERTLRFRLFK